MKPFIQDGHTLILRVIRKLIATPHGADATERGQTPRLVIEEIRTVDWASATFIGKRHCLAMRLEGSPQSVEAALDRVRAGLAEADGAGSGQFLADAALQDWCIAREGGSAIAELHVEALTIEE